MKILITAGNTQTPIDEVRVITNVFSGRTGTQIALHAHDQGHSVCLLTSHPELVQDQQHRAANSPDSVARGSDQTQTWTVKPYRTFDDLHALMRTEITSQAYDAIIHCAAVTDYQLAATYATALGTKFDPPSATWQTTLPDCVVPTLVDVQAGKIKSHHRELWLRMVPTMKLVDQIRTPWGFQGILVKFKLEVGVNDEELMRIATASRQQSRADLIVANTYSGMHAYALLGPVNGGYERLERSDLAHRLLKEMKHLHQSKSG